MNSKSVSAWYLKKGVETEIRGCVSETRDLSPTAEFPVLPRGSPTVEWNEG